VPKALGTASEAVDRLSQLTGDLVRASRGESLELELQPLDLAEVVLTLKASGIEDIAVSDLPRAELEILRSKT